MLRTATTLVTDWVSSTSGGHLLSSANSLASITTATRSPAAFSAAVAVRVISRRAYSGSARRSGRKWWSWWYSRLSGVAARGLDRKHLICAAAVFFWDRERITNQEVLRCLQNFEQRQLSNLRSHWSVSSSSPQTDTTREVAAATEPVNSQAVDTETNVSPTEAQPSSYPSPQQETSGAASLVTDTEQNKSSAGDDGLLPSAVKVAGDGSSCADKDSDSHYQTASHEESSSGAPTSDNISSVKGDEPVNGASDSGHNSDAGHDSMNSDMTSDTTNDSIEWQEDIENANKIQTQENDPMEGWEYLLEEQSCTVYRKLYEDTGLYQYKVIGSYSDISARDFLDVQVDNEGRRSWDSYVVKLERVDFEPHTGSEIIHWILKYPFPMANREYVFVRRAWISSDDDTVVIINRSVEQHPQVPHRSRYVRVKDYYSEMVIKSHSNIDELGLSYELTYFDDPGTHLPTAAVSWVTKSAMPDFLNKLHKAALLKRSKMCNDK